MEYKNKGSTDSPDNKEINQAGLSQKVRDYNPADYYDQLAELNLSPEQRDDLLAVLYEMMQTFVEMGFGTDPVQTLFTELAEKALAEDSATVELNHPEKFSEAANDADWKEDTT